MGLTIHYCVKAPAEWGSEKVRSGLVALWKSVRAIPVKTMSWLAEFRGEECDYDKVGRRMDDFHWAKIQATRNLESPWEPGCSRMQLPERMLVLSILPADGCEQMNVGMCRYPQYVWPRRIYANVKPCWSVVFSRPRHYRESLKVIRGFMRKWKLRRVPAFDGSVYDRFGPPTEFLTPEVPGVISACLCKGRYLSHRRGYSGSAGILSINDQADYRLSFRHAGTPMEAKRDFSSAAFRQDLQDLTCGKRIVIAPERNVWRSFCKTQYANDARLGGWANFVKAHLSVVAVLDCAKLLGFEVDVQDEGAFWETRDLRVLAEHMGELDKIKDPAAWQTQVTRFLAKLVGCHKLAANGGEAGT